MNAAAVVVEDDDELRRHLNPEYRQEDGSYSLAAYKTSNMSLDLCRLRELDVSVASRGGKWGMSQFLAKVPRASGLVVNYDPIKDDPHDADNEAHCLIPGRVNNSQAKKMREAATVVYDPKPE